MNNPRHRLLIVLFTLLLSVSLIAGCTPTAEPAQPAPAATSSSEGSTEVVAETAQELGHFQCPKVGGTYTHAMVGNPAGPDPQIGAGSANLRRMLNQIYDQLITPRLPGELEYQPYLAHSWEVSDDGLIYTFHLREGVTFHDGAPFNSEAVRANVDRILSEPTAMLHNAFQGVTVDTSDEFTVVFIREDVRATFLEDIAAIAFSMISPVVLSQGTSREHIFENPIGTGPYIFVEQVPDDRVVLERNPNWWGGEVCLDQIIFRPIPEAATRILELEAGSVLGIDNVPPDQVNRISQSYDMYDWASCRVEGIIFNVSRPGPTSDPRFREAMRYALDQEAILAAIDATGRYNVETSWLSPKGWLYDAERALAYRYDLAKAQEIWEAAGYVDTDGDGFLNDPESGQNIELEFPNGQFNEFFAQVLQGELLKVGIMTNLTILELNTFYSQYLWPGNYDISIWNSQAEDCDPSGMFEQLRSDNPQNIPQLRDPYIDELLDRGLSRFNIDERRAIYLELIEYIEPMHLYAFVGEKYVQDNQAVNRSVRGYRQDRYRVIKLDQAWIE